MTYNLGQFILTPKGSYSASSTYNALDVVLYQGSSYICKSNGVRNKIPTNTTYWQLLAQAGQATMTEQQKQEIIAGILSQGVVIDSNYNTYTTEEKQKLAGLPLTIGNATLTIKRNNTTIGTFTADSSTDSSVNIQVPTAINDLTGHEKLQHVREYEALSDRAVVIDEIKPNTVYECEVGLISLSINSYAYRVEIQDAMCNNLPSVIVFKADTDFDIELPENAKHNSFHCTNARIYMLKVENDFFTLTEYNV